MMFPAAMRVGSLEVLLAVAAFALFALRGRATEGSEVRAARSMVIELEIVERGRSRRVEGRTPMVVGRATDADVLLMDPQVSRRHARFESDGTAVFITDLQSANGVSLNGRRITESIEVRSGDAIDIGTARILFRGSALATDH